MPVTTVEQEVAARLNAQRRADARAQLEAIEREVHEQDRRELAQEQAKEAAGEAGVAALFESMVAKTTFEIYDRRIVINLSHPDPIIRDFALAAVNRLTRFVIQSVQAATFIARNAGRTGSPVPTTAPDPLWLEKLLSDGTHGLAFAAKHNLLTISDLKGRKIKLQSATPIATTAQPVGHRDEWLSGRE
jgi:hypothetical protein